MSEKMGMDNPEMPEKKEDEKEILKKALPIILQRYEKRQNLYTVGFAIC